MNLKEIKENSEIVVALSPLPVNIVRQGGNIKQIVIGDLNAPIAVIQKGGTYNDWIEVVAAERKTTFTSETEFAGAKLSQSFPDEAAMEKWENGLREDHSGLTFIFSRTSKTVIAE